mmetsp:Transcript_53872/g.100929  ORF Transcript_53872/g.100929 Transcript_53872/m.100929 type:complete len:581 (+) Transcript_53872:47-1789(+)
MVFETNLGRQTSSRPPLLEEEQEPLANCFNDCQRSGQTAHDPTWQQHDMHFERFEELLSRMQELVDALHATQTSVLFKQDVSDVNDTQPPKARKSFVARKELKEEVQVESPPKPEHKEFKLVQAQTKAFDKPSFRDMLTGTASSLLKTARAFTTVSREEGTHHRWRHMLARLLKSWMFEAFFAAVILSNSIFIAIQVEASARDPGAESSLSDFIIGSIYTLLFLFELLARVVADGFQVFCGPDWAWLLLDLVVVASGIFEFVLELALQQQEDGGNMLENLRLLRILRIGRITRAIRVVRLVRFIRSLRQLLYSISQTLRAMVWSLVLLGMIMFLFGLIFTDITTEYLSRDARDVNVDHAGFLASRFGGLESSMHSLYSSITGGLTWIQARDAFAEISALWGFLFEAYIAFCLFAVLNVMTGVFCQSAMESAEKDHELVLQNVVQEKAKFFRALRRLFESLDENHDGGITEAEFEAAVNDPAVRSVFDSLEISASDAWMLFQQLDSDGNQNVDVEEFLEGCMIIKGPARSIDVISIKREIGTVSRKMDKQETDFLKLSMNMQRLCQLLTPDQQSNVQSFSS